MSQTNMSSVDNMTLTLDLQPPKEQPDRLSLGGFTLDTAEQLFSQNVASHRVSDVNDNGELDREDFVAHPVATQAQIGDDVRQALGEGARFFALGEDHKIPPLDALMTTIDTLYAEGHRDIRLLEEIHDDMQEDIDSYFAGDLTDRQLYNQIYLKFDAGARNLRGNGVSEEKIQELINFDPNASMAGQPHILLVKLSMLKDKLASLDDLSLSVEAINPGTPWDMPNDGYGSVSVNGSDPAYNDRDDMMAKTIIDGLTVDPGDPASAPVTIFSAGSIHTSTSAIRARNGEVAGESGYDQYIDIDLSNPALKQVSAHLQQLGIDADTFIFSMNFGKPSYSPAPSYLPKTEGFTFAGYDAVYRLDE